MLLLVCTQLPAIPPQYQEDASKKKGGAARNLMILGGMALVAACGWWALTNTPAGQQVLAATTGLVNLVAEKVSSVVVL
jgi:hypothetical protein